VSLDKALYDNYFSLAASKKQQIHYGKKSTENLEIWKLLSEEDFSKI